MHKQSLKSAAHRCETCILCAGERGFSVKSESSNLAHVRNQIKLIGEHCNLSEKQLFDLQVAVGEATANAIEHGSPLGCDNDVQITAYCNGKALTIAIKDEGVFKRRMPTPGAEMNFRGRGIPLMLALMDRVTIDEAKNGTRVVLVKYMNNYVANGNKEQVGP